MDDLRSRIDRFTASISSNLLAQDDFVDWDAIEHRLSSLPNSIKHLQDFVDTGDLSADALYASLNQHPGTYELLLDLLAFNNKGPQVDKWGLPPTVERGSNRTRWVADQLMYIGLDRLLQNRPDVQSLLRVAEIYKDSYRRRFRSGKKLEERVSELIRVALREANERLEDRVAVNANALSDVQLRRALVRVLAVGNRPIAGIATVFQNQSGGRQQRDLSATYPALQQRLSEWGMALILIADGQGLREASDRTINTLFEGVRFPMTLNQAADGLLASAIAEASTGAAPESIDQTALSRLIEERLRVAPSVKAGDLPTSETEARLALARYATTRQRFSLSLPSTGEQLEWTRAADVQEARSLKLLFNAERALHIFQRLLGVEVLKEQKTGGVLDAELRAPEVQPFAEKLFVRAGLAPVAPELTREIGLHSIEQAPGSSVAIYLTQAALDERQIAAHRKAQIYLPTNVIVVSARLLEMMAEDKRPLDRLMEAVLTQSDLTKVSPFILSNATPNRMFYGRESETAVVLSTVPTNSVALLGSRRMGKTSLIRKLQSELAEANFRVFFGDCQTVRTWNDFADLARRQWNVDLPAEFRPALVDALVHELQSRCPDAPVVIILDEIDQLLDWDQSHSQGSVPEAFFRACRAVSQAGQAQFVFSGERRIANKLWDPQSPHWNFCREVRLTQLTRTAATALLMQPLEAMNIAIPELDEFEAEAWRHTSGHPQIVQYLGDRLIRLLDQRTDRKDLTLTVEDLETVTSTFEFAEHYLETYWGQATSAERNISEIIARQPLTIAQLQEVVACEGVQLDASSVPGAVRMLQLYGVIEEREGELTLRAEWFPEALNRFGGASAARSE